MSHCDKEKVMQIKPYTLEQFIGFLNLNPHFVLKDHAEILVIGPYTETPTFQLIHKDEIIKVEITDDIVRLKSITLIKDTPVIKVVFDGDLPETLVDKITRAINLSAIPFTKVGHVVYTFFGNKTINKVWLTPEFGRSYPITMINEKPVTDLQIVRTYTGGYQITTLVNGVIYNMVNPVDYLTNRVTPTWKKYDLLDTELTVNKIFTRLNNDGLIEIIAATTKGLLRVVGNETPIIVKNTEDLNINLLNTSVDMDTLYFVVNGEPVKLMGFNPIDDKLTPVTTEVPELTDNQNFWYNQLIVSGDTLFTGTPLGDRFISTPLS
jgi:hypothetical protein